MKLLHTRKRETKLFTQRTLLHIYLSTNVARELQSKAFPLVNFAWRHNNNTQALRTNEIFKFSFISTIFVEKEL